MTTDVHAPHTNDAWPRAGADRIRRTSDATHAIFADPASRAFEQLLVMLAPTDATVLIMGETGTGKEVAARELHARSGRTGPFLAVNCAAMTESLAEAELFGHEKGAFTGALKSQPGWFEAADGGTLLLDEIGELPLGMQAKLLRVLQEREVTRIGGRTSRKLNARVIAATNIDLEAAAAAGSFRKDLLYRLNIATVTLRPLRERRQDIEPLARHFLALYGSRFGRVAQDFAEDALAALQRYDWPGNVRELDNVVHRCALLKADPLLRAADLGIGQAAAPTADADQPALEATLRGLAESWIDGREQDVLRRAMRILVQTSFDASGGNQLRAAEMLGVSRNTLRTQLSHLGVIPPRRRGRAEADWTRVRIGIQKFGTSALLRFDGELERRLAEKQILVDWRDFSTGPPLLAALQAGDIDIGSAGEVPPIFAQADGASLAYLAYEPAAPTSVALVVRRDSPVRSMADLKGQRVAVTRGANVHFLLLTALEQDGMTISDIEPVYMPTGVPSGPAALEAANAWMMWDPFLSEVELNGGYRIVRDGTGLVANHRFYVASRHFADTMPDVVATIVEEAQRVGERAAAAPAAAAHDLAATFGMVPAGIEVAMRRLAPGALKLNREVMRNQQNIADRFYAAGLLPKKVSVLDAAWL
jgi:aliphatic sulfonates family ABC transporter substrate-binding protein